MLPRRLLVVRVPAFRPATPRCCNASPRVPVRPFAFYPPLAQPTIVSRLPSSRRLFSQTPRRLQRYDHDPRLQNAKPLVTTGQLGRIARSRNTHGVIVVAILAAVVFYFSNLQTVPVSGRKRFNCFSEESVREVSEMQYKRVLYEVEHGGARFLPEWDPRTLMVKRVMKRLIPVSGMEDQNWEVMVIDDPQTANAFVLPGGKVFVYSGIMPLIRNESGLAAVLGHEIAHNLAEHIAERLSQSIGVNILLGSLLLLSVAIPGGLFVVQFFGGGLLDVLFSRPMNRLQESEADYIGLMMMAEACYDPREAVDFWKRMDRQQQIQPPEWISTHPSVCSL